MANKPKTDETAENTDIKITDEASANTIKELQEQVAMLTKLVTSQAQRNEEAENAFFKQKEVKFTVKTFREPGKQPDINEVKVK